MTNPLPPQPVDAPDPVTNDDVPDELSGILSFDQEDSEEVQAGIDSDDTNFNAKSANFSEEH